MGVKFDCLNMLNKIETIHVRGVQGCQIDFSKMQKNGGKFFGKKGGEFKKSSKFYSSKTTTYELI